MLTSLSQNCLVHCFSSSWDIFMSLPSCSLSLVQPGEMLLRFYLVSYKFASLCLIFSVYSVCLSCIYFWSNQACNLFSFLYPYSTLTLSFTLVKEVLVRLRLSILVLFIPVSFPKFLMSVGKWCSRRVSRASVSLSQMHPWHSLQSLCCWQSLTTNLSLFSSTLPLSITFSLSCPSLFLSLSFHEILFLCNFTLEFYFVSFKLLSKKLNCILSPDPLKCSTSWERTHLIAFSCCLYLCLYPKEMPVALHSLQA